MRSPIHTYGGRGTAKRDIIVEKHAVIYTGNNPPALLPNEPAQRLLEKTPIRVDPEGHFLHKASRINFGKVHTLEHNRKVLPVGRVCSEHMNNLFTYYRQCASPDAEEGASEGVSPP
jgi:hypothetical protein